MTQSIFTIAKGSSVMILPFHIRDIHPNADPYAGFADNLLAKIEDDNAVRKFLEELDKLPQKQNEDIGDWDKYHDFIRDHINLAGNTESKAYLKTYCLDLNALKSLDNKSFQNEFQKKDLEMHLGESDVRVDFDSVYVVVNALAQLGYLVINLKLSTAEDQSLLSSLSSLPFFRFYKPVDVRTKNKQDIHLKYALQRTRNKRLNKDTVEVQQDKIAIYQVIEQYLGNLTPFISFIYQKPVMFHMLWAEHDYFTNQDRLRKACFDVLRIPPEKGEAQKAFEQKQDFRFDMVRLVFPDPNIVYCSMNEGAILIDLPSNDSSKFINKKYLPVFLIALNQREIMIKSSKLISEIRDEELKVEKDSLFKQLSYLKQWIHWIQLKQLSYSISNYNEMSGLFAELQAKFDIETLLKDNKESILGIQSLLESSRIEKEEEEAGKRDNRIALILGILSVFGVASTSMDLFNFHTSDQTLNWRWLPYSVLMMLGILMYRLYRPNKKSN